VERRGGEGQGRGEEERGREGKEGRGKEGGRGGEGKKGQGGAFPYFFFYKSSTDFFDTCCNALFIRSASNWASPPAASLISDCRPD
jgi:hypothetical protein